MVVVVAMSPMWMISVQNALPDPTSHWIPILSVSVPVGTFAVSETWKPSSTSVTESGAQQSERERLRCCGDGGLLVMSLPNCVPVRTYVVPAEPVPTMLPASPSSSKPMGSIDTMLCPFPPAPSTISINQGQNPTLIQTHPARAAEPS